MTWLWILLAVAVLLVLSLFGAAKYFLKVSVIREKKERREEEFYQGEDPEWAEFRKTMRTAQAWMREHTEEHVKLTSYDGLELSALYIPAETETPRGTCIVFHGYRSLATVDFAPEVEFLHGLGYRLLVPYQRAHGESQGQYITYGVKERFDCRSWADYIADRFPGEDIFLMGISMGSSTVMMASDLDLPGCVRGIVADCGFTTPWDIMKHVSSKDYHLPAFPLLYAMGVLTRVQAGFDLKEADSRKSLARTKLPVLFLHGKKDDFVPVFMTDENYAACGSEKELYLVEGAGHAMSFVTDPDGCKEKIASFFEKYQRR